MKKPLYLTKELKRMWDYAHVHRSTRGGGFSRRVHTAVHNYGVLIDGVVLPEFTPRQKMILFQTIPRSDITLSGYKAIPDKVLLCAGATDEEKTELSALLRTLSILQLMKLNDDINNIPLNFYGKDVKPPDFETPYVFD